MIDTSKPIENPELLQALEALHRENTPENQHNALNLVVNNARFITPIVWDPKADSPEKKITQFQVISSKDGKTFFPAFTDLNQLNKLCNSSEQHFLLLSFDEYVSLLNAESRAAGFVINPLDTHPLTLEREFVASLAKQKKAREGYSKKTIQKDTPILFSDANNCPQALLDQVRLVAEPLTEVQNLYLRLMTNPDQGESSYLIIVDHSGNQETVFRTIANAARPHLGGYQVGMVSFDSEFGKAAAEGVEPFFVRKD